MRWQHALSLSALLCFVPWCYGLETCLTISYVSPPPHSSLSQGALPVFIIDFNLPVRQLLADAPTLTEFLLGRVFLMERSSGSSGMVNSTSNNSTSTNSAPTGKKSFALASALAVHAQRVMLAFDGDVASAGSPLVLFFAKGAMESASDPANLLPASSPGIYYPLDTPVDLNLLTLPLHDDIVAHLCGTRPELQGAATEGSSSPAPSTLDSSVAAPSEADLTGTFDSVAGELRFVVDGPAWDGRVTAVNDLLDGSHYELAEPMGFSLVKRPARGSVKVTSFASEVVADYRVEVVSGMGTAPPATAFKAELAFQASRLALYKAFRNPSEFNLGYAPAIVQPAGAPLPATVSEAEALPPASYTFTRSTSDFVETYIYGPFVQGLPPDATWTSAHPASAGVFCDAWKIDRSCPFCDWSHRAVVRNTSSPWRVFRFDAASLALEPGLLTVTSAAGLNVSAVLIAGIEDVAEELSRSPSRGSLALVPGLPRLNTLTGPVPAVPVNATAQGGAWLWVDEPTLANISAVTPFTMCESAADDARLLATSALVLGASLPTSSAAPNPLPSNISSPFSTPFGPRTASLRLREDWSALEFELAPTAAPVSSLVTVPVRREALVFREPRVTACALSVHAAAASAPAIGLATLTFVNSGDLAGAFSSTVTCEALLTGGGTWVPLAATSDGGGATSTAPAPMIPGQSAGRSVSFALNPAGGPLATALRCTATVDVARRLPLWSSLDKSASCSASATLPSVPDVKPAGPAADPTVAAGCPATGSLGRPEGQWGRLENPRQVELRNVGEATGTFQVYASCEPAAAGVDATGLGQAAVVLLLTPAVPSLEIGPGENVTVAFRPSPEVLARTRCEIVATLSAADPAGCAPLNPSLLLVVLLDPEGIGATPSPPLTSPPLVSPPAAQPMSNLTDPSARTNTTTTSNSTRSTPAGRSVPSAGGSEVASPGSARSTRPFIDRLLDGIVGKGSSRAARAGVLTALLALLTAAIAAGIWAVRRRLHAPREGPSEQDHKKTQTPSRDEEGPGADPASLAGGSTLAFPDLVAEEDLERVSPFVCSDGTAALTDFTVTDDTGAMVGLLHREHPERPLLLSGRMLLARDPIGDDGEAKAARESDFRVCVVVTEVAYDDFSGELWVFSAVRQYLLDTPSLGYWSTHVPVMVALGDELL